MKSIPIAAAVATVAGGLLMAACGGLPAAGVAAAPPASSPPADAITALERACLRDPMNAANWARLATALDADGQRDRATRFYRQAAILSAHDARRDYALLADAGANAVSAAGSAAAAVARTVAADAVVAAPVAPSPYADLPRTQVQQLGAAMVQVVRLAAASPPTSAASSLAPAPSALSAPSAPSAPPAASLPASSPQPAPLRLEISNGNGVTGAAARLARMLDADGESTLRLATVRLTNARPFKVPRTRIEYPQAQQQVADALSQQLDIPLKVRRETSPHDLRIVLGHDSSRAR
ncbi:hypothetical protein ASF61_14040 [Duganella sp. Leaf126]|nr:hypothetical protein ASF61_14040 [Duganella sp. Leaf126]